MKVLIVYAKAGAGHRRAAEAVYAAFKRRGQDQDVVLVDCLDYTNDWFRNFYPQSYLFLVRFLPFVWAGIYYLLENRLIYCLIKPLRRLNNHYVSRGFAQFLKREQPRVIISTQFFASEVAAALKRKKEINSFLISVVTDFGLHTFWESEDVDLFVVASQGSKDDLAARNIPAERIKVLGIPIEPALRKADKLKLQIEIGLQANLFTILLVGGGFGVGPIKKLVFSLEGLSDQLRAKIQLVVVCSRNKKLYGEMEGIAARLKIACRVFGFVPDLYQMMVASDVIISKSGGLTTSEALAMGLPMIIISPIPGQETKNCALLMKNGAAIRINRPAQIQRAVKELISSPDKLKYMRQQALSLARPNSAEDIVNLSLTQMK